MSLGRLSHAYVSEPVGMDSQNWFTNAVGMLQTTHDCHQLLALLLEVEAEFGRKRDPEAIGYQDRSLDLDMLYFGEEVVNNPKLTLPHPHLGKRLFVLMPLVEIAPGMSDPLDGMSIEKKKELLIGQIQAGKEESQEVTKIRWDTIPSESNVCKKSNPAQKKGEL